jgi:hypothetical protein
MKRRPPLLAIVTSAVVVGTLAVLGITSGVAQPAYEFTRIIRAYQG